MIPLPDPRQIGTAADFARALRTLRTRAGLSVRDVAGLVARQSPEPVPASTLGGWFSGCHLPTPRLVRSGAVAMTLTVCGVTDGDELRQWFTAIDRVRRMPGPRPRRGPNPYRGLGPYGPGDARFLFGRDELVRELVSLATRPRGGPVFVIGASASGKSSLVSAGLIPALGRDRSTADRPPYLTIRPGADPLSRLAAALSWSSGDPDKVRLRLSHDPGTAADLVGAAVAAGSPGQRPLVVVDQFEEVFTASADPVELRRFIEAVVAAGEAAAIVVLCLRADYYTAALALPILVPVLQDAQLVVGPMDPRQLRQVIVEPAHVAGGEVEPALVELILSEMIRPEQTPSARLPMLSQALRLAWQSARGGRITVDGYRATGGVPGAVAATADAVYLGLPSPAHRAIARRMLLRLASTDGWHGLSRIPRSYLAGNDEVARSVLDEFLAARLLTADTEPTGPDLTGRTDSAGPAGPAVETIEFTHEVLVGAWPRLLSWLEADAAQTPPHHRPQRSPSDTAADRPARRGRA